MTGEIVFFLDADDRYLPTYVAKALACYERTSADFVMAGMENFGPSVRGKQPNRRDRDLGISVLTTTFARKSVGKPTSSLSLRTSLSEKDIAVSVRTGMADPGRRCAQLRSVDLGRHKYQIGETLVKRACMARTCITAITSIRWR